MCAAASCLGRSARRWQQELPCTLSRSESTIYVACIRVNCLQGAKHCRAQPALGSLQKLLVRTKPGSSHAEELGAGRWLHSYKDHGE